MHAVAVVHRHRRGIGQHVDRHRLRGRTARGVRTGTAARRVAVVGDLEAERVRPGVTRHRRVLEAAIRVDGQAAVCRTIDEAEQQRAGGGFQVAAGQLPIQRGAENNIECVRQCRRCVVDRPHGQAHGPGRYAAQAIVDPQLETVAAVEIGGRRVAHLAGRRIEVAEHAVYRPGRETDRDRVAVRVAVAERQQHGLVLVDRPALQRGHHRRPIRRDRAHGQWRRCMAAILVGGGHRDREVAAAAVAARRAGRAAGQRLRRAVTPAHQPAADRVLARIRGREGDGVGNIHVDARSPRQGDAGCDIGDEDVETRIRAADAVTYTHRERHRQRTIGGGKGQHAGAGVDRCARNGRADQGIGQGVAVRIGARYGEVQRLALVDGGRHDGADARCIVHGPHRHGDRRGRGNQRVAGRTVRIAAVGDGVGERVHTVEVGIGHVGPQTARSEDQAAMGRLQHRIEDKVAARRFHVEPGQQDLHRKVLVGDGAHVLAAGGGVDRQYVDDQRAVVGAEVAIVDAEAEAVGAVEVRVGRVAHGMRHRIEVAQHAVERVAHQAEAQHIAVRIGAAERDQHAGGLVGTDDRVGCVRRLIAAAIDRETAHVVAAGNAIGVAVEQVAGGVEDAQRTGQPQPVVAFTQHAIAQLQRQVGLGERVTRIDGDAAVVGGAEDIVGTGIQQLVVGRAARTDAVQRLAEVDLQAAERRGRGATVGRQLADHGDGRSGGVVRIAQELVGADVVVVQARGCRPFQRVGGRQIALAIVRSQHIGQSVAGRHADGRRQSAGAGAVVEAEAPVLEQGDREVDRIGRSLEHGGPADRDLPRDRGIGIQVACRIGRHEGAQVVPQRRDAHPIDQALQAVAVVAAGSARIAAELDESVDVDIGGGIALPVERERKRQYVRGRVVAGAVVQLGPGDRKTGERLRRGDVQR